MNNALFDKFVNFSLNNVEIDDVISLRMRVFVEEQKILYTDEFDGVDNILTQYFCGYANMSLIACILVTPEANLIKTVRIARVLVAQTYRGKGYGSEAIRLVVEELQRQKQYDFLLVNSQKAVVAFYQKLGFELIGNENMEAGIPHIFLRKALNTI